MVDFTLELDRSKIHQVKKRAFELNLDLIESQIKDVFYKYFENQAKNSSTGLCTVIDIQVSCSKIEIGSLTGVFI